MTSAVVVWSHPHGPARAAADTLFAPQNVWNQVATGGRARVLVEVQLPQSTFVPEGRLPSLAHVLAQRSGLAFSQSQILGQLQGLGHTVAHRFETAPYMALEVDADALRQLEASRFYVRQIVEDTLHTPLLAQSGPIVQANQVWANGFDGTGTVIAVLDTGVDKTHPFLAGKVVAEACFSTSSVGQTVSVCPNGQSQQIGPGAGVNCPVNVQTCWHGTHVAGIAAGNGVPAGVAYSGVAKGANLMAVQVFSQAISFGICGLTTPCAMAFLSDILAGLEHVYNVRAQHNIAAVNLSLGRGKQPVCDNDPAAPFIGNLLAAGIPTVAAAGNDGAVSGLSAPACVSTAVSVGSTSKGDSVSPFSNVGPHLSLFAPGEGILSSFPGGAWHSSSGTSMATPHVSGAFAILKQASPGSSVTALLTALQQTGLPVTDERLLGLFKPRIRLSDALSTLSTVAPALPLALGRDRNDFNGDATADILWRNNAGDIAVWFLNQASVVSGALFGSVALDWAIAGVADFNGDGRSDLLWRHSSGLLTVWLMNGTTVSANLLVGSVGTDWSIVGVADFNGDGKADILWRHASGLVAVWLMNGATPIGSGVLGTVAADWSVVGVGKFNGDANADILWRHVSGTVAVWFLNGLSVVSSGLLGDVSTAWTVVGVGDFNGDGRADILWRHTSMALSVWLLNGLTIVSGALAEAPAGWTLSGIADFNGDGKADVLWRHGLGTIVAWLVDGLNVVGSGVFEGPSADWQIQ